MTPGTHNGGNIMMGNGMGVMPGIQGGMHSFHDQMQMQMQMMNNMGAMNMDMMSMNMNPGMGMGMPMGMMSMDPSMHLMGPGMGMDSNVAIAMGMPFDPSMMALTGDMGLGMHSMHMSGMPSGMAMNDSMALQMQMQMQPPMGTHPHLYPGPSHQPRRDFSQNLPPSSLNPSTSPAGSSVSMTMTSAPSRTSLLTATPMRQAQPPPHLQQLQ